MRRHHLVIHTPPPTGTRIRAPGIELSVKCPLHRPSILIRNDFPLLMSGQYVLRCLAMTPDLHLGLVGHPRRGSRGGGDGCVPPPPKDGRDAWRVGKAPDSRQFVLHRPPRSLSGSAPVTARLALSMAAGSALADTCRCRGYIPGRLPRFRACGWPAMLLQLSKQNYTDTTQISINR